MQQHEERVIAESDELRDKLTKLCAFISRGDVFGTLPEEEQRLLREQRDLMGEYLDVLGKRIARFA